MTCDLTSLKKLTRLSALLLAVLVPTACAVTEDDQEGGVHEEVEALKYGPAVTPAEPGEDFQSTQERAPSPTAALASGWTYLYIASVSSETYRLSKNGDLRGLSSFSTNILLKDTAPDGLGQRVYWRVYGTSTWKICDHEGGNGTQSTCNVTNDKFIQYQFCMKDGNTIIACAPEDGRQT